VPARAGLTQSESPLRKMATRSKLAALGRQLRASAPLVGMGVPTLSGAPAAALPAMSFAAVDTVEYAPACAAPTARLELQC